MEMHLLGSGKFYQIFIIAGCPCFVYNSEFMNVKSFDLFEQIEHVLLTVLAGGERERLLRRHCGLLRRAGNGRRDWMSMALNTLKGEQAESTPSRRRLIEDSLELNQRLDLDRIARQHEALYSLLDRLVPGAWKVQYRAEMNRRLHMLQGLEPVVSRFDYLGLLVSIDLDRSGQSLEIGEGSVRGSQLNIDGLCRRIEALVENHRSRKRVSFSGPVDLVLPPGDGAILFHEIAGHALEADHIAQRRSPLWSAKMGEAVAADTLNLSSGDPRDAFFGHIACDDEGEGHKAVDLIREGRLTAFMGDSFYESEIEGCQKGFARSSDYTQVPQPRMFGMFVKSGDKSEQEIMTGIRRGILASEFGPGTARLERDRFQFRIHAADLIENGKITAHLGAVDVTGSIRDTLMNVRAVGDDFRFDRGVSYCVKNRQTIHVRVGQPTVHIGGIGVKPLSGT